MSRKRVLIISYYFPPSGGPGVHRTVKFVKNLGLYGWQPVILTSKNRQTEVHDDSLRSEIPADTIVYESYSIEPRKFRFVKNTIDYRRGSHLVAGKKYRLKRFLLSILVTVRDLLLVPDEKIGWVPFAIYKGLKIVYKEDIQVIHSISYPYSSHLIGLVLKLLTRRPLIIDLTDLWVDNPILKVRRIEHVLEKAVVSFSDRIITNTPSMLGIMLRRYHAITKEKFSCITNGYDEQDFGGAEQLVNANDYVMSFVGGFYDNIYTKGRFKLSPEYFLQALKSLKDENLLERRVRVQFIGAVSQRIRDHIRTLHLEDILTVLDYVEHKKAIAYMVNSDLLLLFTGDDSAWVPMKTYEYLRAGKPILALSKEGAVAKIISEHNAGIVVDPVDISQIRQAILSLLTNSSFRHISPNGFLEKYEWKNLTCTLANLFEEVYSTNRNLPI